MLSDWSFENPETIFRNINLNGDYYNFQKRTVFDYFDDVSDKGFSPATKDWMAWGNRDVAADALHRIHGIPCMGHHPAARQT